eukprot:2268481-Lingulodinium_polyedra.AAC.1
MVFAKQSRGTREAFAQHSPHYSRTLHNVAMVRSKSIGTHRKGTRKARAKASAVYLKKRARHS